MARKTSVRFASPRYPLSTYVILGLLLVISAFLMAFAMVLPNYPWLSFTTLIPLFVAIRLLTPSRAASAGALWGLSLAFFSGLFPDSPLTFSVLSTLVLGAAPAAYAYAATHLTHRFGFNPFILGLGWLVVELGLSPFGLETGLIASSQHENLLITSVGQSLGYLLVGYLIVFANALILFVLADVRIKGLSVPRRGCVASDRGANTWLGTDLLRSFALLYPVQPRAPPF